MYEVVESRDRKESWSLELWSRDFTRVLTREGTAAGKEDALNGVLTALNSLSPSKGVY